uniref:Large ribosomal subunit protein uL6 n=1 Tax=Candidatus Methanogaster sp. ANME-2c ERB4 TaxID=2759911 RepID=A0A7G9Y008_9EURY|nr:50S ribosomal protein L6 [Methanosarcinales archaeon ANME-2c ERB4]QNO41999.1 50S ribosomal protein L6 [Methanosarcinales archaeon ANME-2c ERB4]QNO42588.1 50S ribosomal protein L6 [Methanosarcinales archaeon ANME-2c ERB4]QNO48748.1 50S ribosomal protein L6 [Methanosarcinales archaeon ANME-2c ERB4]
MAKEIKKTVAIPDDVTVSIDGRMVTVSGPKGEVSRELWYPHISIQQIDDAISVDVDAAMIRKKQKAMVGTLASHIKNMIDGVAHGYRYRMKMVYSHFPVQLRIDGGKFIIGNFLGEKKDRVAQILDGSDVEINGDEVTVTGINKESVGQTAANIEQATKIKARDPRVFQDGIYVIGKEMMS